MYYVLLISKGSELLASTSMKRIKKRLSSDKAFSAECYQACIEFSYYINLLQTRALHVIDVGYDLLRVSLSLGSKYRLLPTDALHVATCQQQGITHMATADTHFDVVDTLNIWHP